MQNLVTNQRDTLVMISKDHTTVLRAALFLVFTLLFASQVLADSRTQAKRMHDRLTGVAPSSAILDEMTNLLSGATSLNDFKIANPKYDNVTTVEMAAAYVAMENKHFYNATLVNFITPWTNEAQAVFPEDMIDEGILNDYTATVIGVIRDEIDFRRILYDDILYVATGASVIPAVPAYSFSDNAHYKEIEKRGLDLSDDNVLVRTTQSGIPLNVLETGDTAGVLTSRAGAKAFFVDGTNRAMFRFTALNHLCKDMEQLKDVSLPADRIRQDVSRSPGGDSRIYMNECIGCHTGMDPMTQAFAYYDYDYPDDVNGDPDYAKGELVFNKVNTVDVDRFNQAITGATRIQAKNLINSGNFKPGYITTDDSWVNYWREGKNSVIGDKVDILNSVANWDSSLNGSGSGAKSMAKELAHSEQFARCQVEKVFEAVCLRKAGDVADRTAVNSILNNFKSEYMVSGGPGYELKQVFAETAVYCKGQ